MNHLDRNPKKFQGTNVLKKCIFEIFYMLKNIYSIKVLQANYN
jgi:hypothetical protein